MTYGNRKPQPFVMPQVSLIALAINLEIQRAAMVAQYGPDIAQQYIQQQMAKRRAA